MELTFIITEICVSDYIIGKFHSSMEQEVSYTETLTIK